MTVSRCVAFKFLSCLAVLTVVFPATAVCQSVCSQSSLTGCKAQAQSAYEVCLRDNPKGSTVCSNGLATQTAACNAKYGVCAAGSTCQSGVCINPAACSPGLSRCGSSCTNLKSDSLNCGACGNSCKSGQSCTAGACVEQTSCNQTDFDQCSAVAAKNDKSCLANVPDISKQTCQNALNNAVAKCQALYESCGGSETLYPAALLLTVLYAAPGNASSVAFSQSNSEGTTTSINNTFAHGATLTFSASGGVFTGASVDVSFGVTLSGQNSSSFQTTATSTEGIGIKSASDKIDHTQDQFYILLNPAVTVNQNGFTSATYTLGTYDNQCANIINVSAAELMNPALIDQAKLGNQHPCGSLVLPGLSSLCANPSQCVASDFAQFLAQDPLVSSDTTQAPADTNRFQLVNRRTLEGPDFVGADQTPNTFQETDATVTTMGQTESQSYSVGVTVGGSAVDLGVFNVQTKAGQTFTWTNSTSKTTASGTSTQEQVTFSTSTVGCEESVDIYTDLMYHTFAYVVAYPACPPTSATPAFVPQVSGKVTTPKGPASQQLVVVTLADKTIRRVYTDSKGNFTLDSAPSGSIQVTAGGTSTTGTIVAGKATVLNVQIASQ